MSTKSDSELLIRIDERVKKISENHATKDDVVNAINVHCLNEHTKKGSIPPSPRKLPINKERILWILAFGLAAAISGGMKLFQ